MSDRLLFTGFLLEMIVGDDSDKEGADDGGQTMLRLLRLVPFDRGWATPAGPPGARPPAAAARSPVCAAPPESTEGDFRRLFSAASSATCFSILLLGLFLRAKTWLISGMAASIIFFPKCLATGRMYLRTTGMATLAIRIANAPKPPAPAPICRAGPQNVAFC